MTTSTFARWKEARLEVAGRANCAPGRIRTCDARFRKPTLYPLSYGARKHAIRPRSRRRIPTTAAIGIASGAVGQPDEDARPRADGRTDRDGPAVPVDDGLGDGEAEAGPGQATGPGVRRAEEPGEQQRLFVIGDANPGIGNLHFPATSTSTAAAIAIAIAIATTTTAATGAVVAAGTTAADRHRTNSDAAVSRRELDRVRQDVLEQLRQPVGVPGQRWPVVDVEVDVDGPGGRVGGDRPLGVPDDRWRRRPARRRAAGPATPGCRARRGRRRAGGADRRCGRSPPGRRPARSRRRRRRRFGRAGSRAAACSRRSTSTAYGARGRPRRATRSGTRPSRRAVGSRPVRTRAAAPVRLRRGPGW